MNENEIRDIIRQSLAQDAFEKITISNPFKKNACYNKIAVVRKASKDSTFFQISMFYDTRVKHENEKSTEDACDAIIALLKEGYKQCHVITAERETTILMSRKGACKIMHRRVSRAEKPITAHDDIKNYIIPEGIPVPWLAALGVMNGEGYVLKQMRKKFKQINRFLEMVSDVEKYISRGGNIIDFGCGKSYLTFALYHYFNVVKGWDIGITGLDLKKDVMDECGVIAANLGYEKLSFVTGGIEGFVDDETKADMVVCLHACDTATDYALYQAICRDASVILSAPCCQHQLMTQIGNNALQPMLKHGILKERFSTLLTDALRGLLLESCGYKVTVMEFIDTEHTPKNIMIRAIKNANSARKREALLEARLLMQEYQVKPELYGLLYGDENSADDGNGG